MKLQIKLYHQYSELDKEHQFGVVTESNEYWNSYINWIWFYMGKKLGSKNYAIYPCSIGDAKPKRIYKNCNNAIKQANLLVNAMDSILNKSKK